MSRRSRRTAPSSAGRLPPYAVRGLVLDGPVGGLLAVASVDCDRPSRRTAGSERGGVGLPDGEAGDRDRRGEGPAASDRAVEEGPARGAAAEEGQRLAEGDRRDDLDQGPPSGSPSAPPRKTTKYRVLAKGVTIGGRDPASRDNPRPARSRSSPSPRPSSSPPRRWWTPRSSVTATLAPVRAGRTVTLQRQAGSGWTAEDTGLEGADGTVDVRAGHLRSPASSTYRVVAAAAKGAPSVASAARTVVVKAGPDHRHHRRLASCRSSRSPTARPAASPSPG